ncbi:hypothetical protein D0Z06_10990 [Geodermatophilus marinus]|nr:hypothetical protein D0Z06_10990 [Geodermatophilus sp. LHW52908]
MVGLIPYLRNAYTAGVHPMKLYEYLSSGLSVVATPLQSLTGETVEGLHIHEPADFPTFVRHEIDSFDEAVARQRQEAARGHSWEARLEQVAAVLDRENN